MYSIHSSLPLLHRIDTVPLVHFNSPLGFLRPFLYSINLGVFPSVILVIPSLFDPGKSRIREHQRKVSPPIRAHDIFRTAFSGGRSLASRQDRV